jgi:hypothetical protein
MVQAISTTIGAVAGALGKQSRSPTTALVREDKSSLAIASSMTDKRAKQVLRNAQDERLMALLTDPAIIGILALVVGLYLTEKIPWSEDEERKVTLRTVAQSGVILTSLGRAGVGDLTTLSVAGIAGIAGLFGGGSWLTGDSPPIMLMRKLGLIS